MLNLPPPPSAFIYIKAIIQIKIHITAPTPIKTSISPYDDDEPFTNMQQRQHQRFDPQQQQDFQQVVKVNLHHYPLQLL